MNEKFEIVNRDNGNGLVPLRIEIIYEDAKLIANYLKSKDIKEDLHTDNISDISCCKGKLKSLGFKNSSYYNGKTHVLQSEPKHRLDSIGRVIETLNEYRLNKKGEIMERVVTNKGERVKRCEAKGHRKQQIKHRSQRCNIELVKDVQKKVSQEDND